jgi:beta-galactosidase
MKKSFYLRIMASVTGLLFYIAATAQVPNAKETGLLSSNTSFPKPFLGAKIILEPGQNPEKIDAWFKILKDNHFNVGLIVINESVIKKGEGKYDFSLYDQAFKSAENYSISVIATVLPSNGKSDNGGLQFPKSEVTLQSLSQLLKVVTTHFQSEKSLAGWLTQTEPLTLTNTAWTNFLRSRYDTWLSAKRQKNNPGSSSGNFSDSDTINFVYDSNKWFSGWLSGEIRKSDPDHEIIVNKTDLFGNVGNYNGSDSGKPGIQVGGTANASGEFGYFTRPQFPVALSAASEIIRSGAGKGSWYLTSLQGGNITFSSDLPLCPTKDEIAQWLWIMTASGCNGGIFSSLNSSVNGIAAGESGLLDFQSNPSERMKQSSIFAQTINEYKALFQNAREVESGINILYVNQSLWAENRIPTIKAGNFEARKQGGVMKSVLGYFETFSRMGVNVNIKNIEEFDFSMQDFSGTTIILADQISLPDKYASLLEGFVNRGGKLIIDGMTAFFDENLINRMQTDFPYKKLFGGNIREFRSVADIFRIQWSDYLLPAHLWRGSIIPEAGAITILNNGEEIAVRNKIGKGEVLWIPSLVGLGAKMTDDYSSLIRFLGKETSQSIAGFPVKFKTTRGGLIMKTLASGNSLITVIVSKSENLLQAELNFVRQDLTPTLIFSNKQGKVTGTSLQIFPEETMVIEWK